jgi:hypothetical protein
LKKQGFFASFFYNTFALNIMSHLYPLIFLVFTVLIPLSDSLDAQSENLRSFSAFKTDGKIKIDGILNEPDWKKAEIAKDFTVIDPNPGRPATQTTFVRVIYTDASIIIGAEMKDPFPDSIKREITPRDGGGNYDWYSVYIDPFESGQNGFAFLVSAAGVQQDSRVSLDGTDENWDASWNAVWFSSVKITEDGWVAEVEIPFATIRFPNKPVQSWNINHSRVVRRTREKSAWNFADPKITGFINQTGKLTGLHDLKPPVRLSAFPYLALNGSHNYNPNNHPKNFWEGNISGGMDIKYGLGNSFTLDMSLIPDFGNVRSDNRVFNLSPFEVQFDEFRPFFTEGTEIFQRGGLFYSRRIGEAGPLRIESPEPGESRNGLSFNPQIYNATKLSGRTNSGLGIGVFNSIQGESSYIVENANGESRRLRGSPLTNFSVLVADQQLKNNSYLAFINTNVWRSGHFYDANVLGTEFNFRDKKNEFSLSGNGSFVRRFGTENRGDGGHAGQLNFAKTAGNWQGDIGYNLLSHHYDPNDLGFLFNPNERTTSANVTYNIFKPFWKFNRMRATFSNSLTQMDKPSNAWSNFSTGVNYLFFTKNFTAFGGEFNVYPWNEHDYFEPRRRTFDRYYIRPSVIDFYPWVSTDYRKPVALDVSLGTTTFRQDDRNYYFLRINPRWRVSDRMAFIFSNDNEWSKADEGFIRPNSKSIGFNSLSSDATIIGRRDIVTVTNTLTGKYSFGPLAWIDLRLRHYWSRVDYTGFFSLENAGQLRETRYSGMNEKGDSYHSTTAAFLNLDLIFTWRFAAGSDMVVTWKNAIDTEKDNVSGNYWNGISELGRDPRSDFLSIKVIYFLDYWLLKTDLDRRKRRREMPDMNGFLLEKRSMEKHQPLKMFRNHNQNFGI